MTLPHTSRRIIDMKRKLIPLILSIGIVGALLTGCGDKDSGSADKRQMPVLKRI